MELVLPNVVYGPVASPKKAEVAVVTRPHWDASLELRVVDLARGRVPHRVTLDVQGSVAALLWDPVDGGRLALAVATSMWCFGQTVKIYVLTLADKCLTLVGLLTARLEHIEWSCDGKYLCTRSNNTFRRHRMVLDAETAPSSDPAAGLLANAS